MFGDKARRIKDLEDAQRELSKKFYDLELKMMDIAQAAGLKWCPPERGKYQRSEP